MTPAEKYGWMKSAFAMCLWALIMVTAEFLVISSAPLFRELIGIVLSIFAGGATVFLIILFFRLTYLAGAKKRG